MCRPVAVYQKFSSGQKTFRLSFLFCSNAAKLQRKHSLDKSRSENQIKMQSIFLLLVQVLHKWSGLGFGLFILKFAYENVMLTQFRSPAFFYSLLLIKLIGYCAFLVSFQSCLCTILVTVYEVILSSNYLANRLDVLTDQIFELIASRRPEEKRLLKMGSQLCKHYNRVLQDHRHISRHFMDSHDFPAVLVAYFVVWPALIIFEPAPAEKLPIIVFYVTNHLIVTVAFSVIVYYN